jgi:hypothetical protein
MHLFVIDKRNSVEQHYQLTDRAELFDLDSDGNLRPIPGAASGRGLRIEQRDRNVLLTDLGAKEKVRLANWELPPQTPWVWQANQELHLGPTYVLFWRPTRSRWQRLRRALVAERLSPFFSALTVLLFAVVLLLVGGWLLGSYRSTIGSVQRNPTWLASYFSSFPTPATATPTATPTMLTAMLSIRPTVVMTVTALDKPPTATPTPTPTLSVTEVVKLIGAGAVVDGTPVITQHAMTPAPEQWDADLDRLGVVYEPAYVPIGGQFWRLLDAQWLDETESTGLHHVFVEVLDEDGNRILEPVTMTMEWTTDQCVRYMQNTPPLQIGDRQFRPYGMHCPMYSAGAVYNVRVNGFGLPSDTVRNLGLGTPAYRDWNIRTSFLLTFQRTTREK